MSSIAHQELQDATVLELCSHIVTQHHVAVREAIPRIEGLIDAVVCAHAHDRPGLRGLQRAFGQFRAELEPHLLSEEDLLFPACMALERQGRPVEESLLAAHERDHASLRHALAALRVLAGDYDPERAVCSTHAMLLEALAAFERDLLRPVDEENGLLFPRVRSMGLKGESARASAGLRRPPARQPGHYDIKRPVLPACCEAWIGEQTHAWARGCARA